MAEVTDNHQSEARYANENISEDYDKAKKVKPEAVPKNDTHANIYFLLLITGVILGLVFEIMNLQHRSKEKENGRPKYWVYSADSNVHNRNGILQNVHTVLSRLGYEKSTNESPWNLLWSHSYPFRVMNLRNLKPHQRVNHFPGTGFITNKVDLATTESKYIPKAFRFPESKEKFLEYASKTKDAWFLVKSNQHRGVVLKNVNEIDLDSKTSFVQEYIKNPFLVDGYKFDIGVYVVLTSVDPLRVYWFKGDVLFRFCPKPYHPFDPADVDRYVIAEDYLPIWDVPSLKYLYKELGFTMKNSFDAYVRSKGKNPSVIWEGVSKVIADIFLAKEKHIVQALQSYLSRENFFEMMRVDLIVDEDLKVHLLEANMSPNLSHAHFPANKLFFEQIIYNLFNLVGVASALNGYKPQDEGDKEAASRMVSADRNIAVWAARCNSTCEGCEGGAEGGEPVCALCRPCMRHALRRSLYRAHTEHLHRGDFRRLVPPRMTPNASSEDLKNLLADLTPTNKLQYLWYQGKCNIDVTYCT